MLLVPALLSKNPRFIKNTTTENGYQAVFSHSLLLNENTYVHTVTSEMYESSTLAITEELTFRTALLIVKEYLVSVH